VQIVRTEKARKSRKKGRRGTAKHGEVEKRACFGRGVSKGGTEKHPGGKFEQGHDGKSPSVKASAYCTRFCKNKKVEHSARKRDTPAHKAVTLGETEADRFTVSKGTEAENKNIES